MSNQHLSEQEIQRRESLNKIIEMGINPFPAETMPAGEFSYILIGMNCVQTKTNHFTMIYLNAI